MIRGSGAAALHTGKQWRRAPAQWRFCSSRGVSGSSYCVVFCGQWWRATYRWQFDWETRAWHTSSHFWGTALLTGRHFSLLLNCSKAKVETNPLPVCEVHLKQRLLWTSVLLITHHNNAAPLDTQRIHVPRYHKPGRSLFRKLQTNKGSYASCVLKIIAQLHHVDVFTGALFAPIDVTDTYLWQCLLPCDAL